jgi:hypothetical protein
MPYILKKNTKKKSKWKKWLIIRGDTKETVASSDTRAKALRSIGYREEALKEDKKVIKVL